jgi:hypothetical protein
MIELDTWITQFGVRTQKLCKLQVLDSCSPEVAGRPASPRPAGPAPQPNTSCLATRPLGTLQWTPYELDIQANTKVMTERPSTWIKRPICSTYRDLLDRSTTMDFIHMLISKPVKRRAEMCQLQAGWPRGGRPAYNFQRWSQATYTDILRRSGASTRRSAPNGGNPRPTDLGEASQPHFAASWAHLHVETTSTDPLAYTRRLGQIPTSS